MLANHNRETHSRNYEKFAIAAAVILAILALASSIYLLIWYLRRRLRVHNLRQVQENDLFGHSAVSVAEDTSRTLDDFLMNDIPPERTSIRFSRSQSPSITANLSCCKPSLRAYSQNYETSGASLAHINNTLGRVAAQKSVPGEMQSDEAERGTGQSSSSTTPRASISSIALPTPRSSQMWTTTSTETLSNITRASSHSYDPPSPTGPSTTRSSHIYTHYSSPSRGSSRPSSTGLMQSASLMFDQVEMSELTHARSVDSAGLVNSTSSTSPLLENSSVDLERFRWAPFAETPFPSH